MAIPKYSRERALLLKHLIHSLGLTLTLTSLGLVGGVAHT